VVINERTLGLMALAGLQQQTGLKIPAGDYWYDPRCGAMGAQGGPCLGYLPSGLSLGSLRAERTGTRVFVNDRELHPSDIASLQVALGPIRPGRYWLDGQGNYGVEGQRAAGNLVAMAQRAQQLGRGSQGGGGGAWGHRSSYGGGDVYVGGDGDFGYVMTGDTAVSWGD
jgi:hypothetical protein